MDKPKANLDAVGIFWIVFCLSWTIILCCGMIFLWRRRHMPMLKIRGLGISFTAILFLHMYWGAVQTGYCYLPLCPPVIVYMIMSIWLPFGIALFNASNSRFLHIAQKQRDLFAAEKSPRETSKREKPTTLLGRFRNVDYSKKILILVGIGMAFQFCLTLFMYLSSRKFHDSFGIPGTEVTGTKEERLNAQMSGWEWWPSVFWQVLWAWIVAPVILWKARKINDTQGWRFQTIASCIVSLHATPMWLIAVYVPAMAPINKYWIPPQWIAISVMMLEILTVFFPIWEVLRHQTLRQETLESIAQWEANKKGGAGGAARSVITGSTTMAGSGFTVFSKDSKLSAQESILTMSALEHVLERNPEPLQKFSALRDFSGENIAFLRAVAEWKSSLPASVRDPEGIKDGSIRELVRERFNSALRIYTNFVSSRDAEFQINLSSADLKKLEDVFETSARILYGDKQEVDPATPFDMFAGPSIHPDNASSNGSEIGIMMQPKTDTEVIGDKALYWGEIPDSFDENIFNDSEASIKYLVLTNTWPKFVKDRRLSLDSEGRLEAGNAL
ncbi:regulator of G protein signaling superfamily [Mariannaea sp. PMI_226]|nr:regulator of G protein signaling superfamily [Mariannaea sp. PMI_226]